MESCLPSMKVLNRFVLAQARYLPLTAEKCNQDMRSVRSWGNICPTLNSCHLPCWCCPQFLSASQCELTKRTSAGSIWLRIDRVIWIPTHHDSFISQWWSEIVLAGTLDEDIVVSDWFLRGEQLNEGSVDARREVLISTQAELSAAIH